MVRISNMAQSMAAFPKSCPFTQLPANQASGPKVPFAGPVEERITQTGSLQTSSTDTSTQIPTVDAAMSESNGVQKRPKSPKRSKRKTPERETRSRSSMERHIAAEPRYEISSTDSSIRQSSADCWDDLAPFPQNGPHEEDRDDDRWLPFLQRLGLQQGVYPSIDVQGKVRRPGKPSGASGRPDWNFMAYTLVALSPKGKLMQREIYNLSLAWCKTMPPNNATCRHSLSEMNTGKHGEASLVREDNFYRLRNAGEGSPSTTDDSVPSSPSLTGDSAKLTSSATSTEGPEQTKASGDADKEGEMKVRVNKKRKRSVSEVMDELTAPMQDVSRASPQTDANLKCQKIPNYRHEAQANNNQVSQKQSKQTEINNTDFHEKETDAAEGIDHAVREKIKNLCYLERFIDRAIQQGQGRCKYTFGTDQHPFEIRERVRHELECYLSEGGELLNIPALVAYQTRHSNSRLPNGRTLLPSRML